MNILCFLLGHKIGGRYGNFRLVCNRCGKDTRTAKQKEADAKAAKDWYRWDCIHNHERWPGDGDCQSPGGSVAEYRP